MDQAQNNFTQDGAIRGGEGNKGSTVTAPDISLPKGGGAIRGIGEKFGANPVTGTGSLTVPIYTSPGRSGFGPELSLSYDSGAGNGPFGFGWSLSLPSITRKTDKGLPQYQDHEESDEFILSGAEDLVPSEVVFSRTVNNKNYDIQRYRPRIEGLFAIIERWTNSVDSAEMFWRSISKDNITTWYGKTDESRIADPSDPTRIFSWLICESYDDKGNVIIYRYKAEDSANVDFSQVHEKNRTDESRKVNRYLKCIRYGNHKPYLPELLDDKPWPIPPGAPGDNEPEEIKWFFEVVFDYGEHEVNVPEPTDSSQWKLRQDPFSTYRAGFEMRTYRLCQRVLMFHHFSDEQDVGTNCLVRSTDFTYLYEQQSGDARNPIHSILVEVSQSGYKRKGENSYLKKSLPALEFEYSQAKIDETVRTVDPESMENLPYGLDGAQYQWVDLDGEGLSGILTEQAEGWFYKANISPIPIQNKKGQENVEARFGPVQLVAKKPSLAAISDGRQQLLDLAGDGQLDLVDFGEPTPGFYERTHEEHWESFKTFESLPNLDWGNPNLKFIDLTGDGHADVLISENDVFCWYPSLAEAGFGPPERVRKALEEEQGPRLVFNDGTQSIYLTDMSGDGLTDIARIRNGEVCYWPNLGYGRFGSKLTMDDSPRFDTPGIFSQGRIRLADIDGSGVTDIIYLAAEGVQLYFNHSGNSWSKPKILTNVPATDDVKNVTVLDLLGTGTACLLWSSPLPGDMRRQMRYVALIGEANPNNPAAGQKPHLLISVKNNLGAETHVHYAPSTKFYLQDEQNGSPWITKIPFPVHVVEQVETIDTISKNRFTSHYAYHHGYFDGVEREFRGFGMVEQWDTEEYAAIDGKDEFLEHSNIDRSSHIPPIHTKTWFHTGFYTQSDKISLQYLHEYFGTPDRDESDYEKKLLAFTKTLLPDTILPDNLTVIEEREACRALKGSMLRQEVYADDASDKAKIPYIVTEQNFTIECLQHKGDTKHAVFFTHAREAISYHYERNLDDPRISHAMTLEVDRFGNACKSLAIAYGRIPKQISFENAKDRKKQEQTLIVYSENDFTKALTNPADPDNYRTPLPCEARSYEVTGLTPINNTGCYSFIEFTDKDFAVINSLSEIKYEQQADPTKKEKRLIECVRSVYRKNDLTKLLDIGKIESMALPGESYQLAFTPGLLKDVYTRQRKTDSPKEDLLFLKEQNKLNQIMHDEGGYVDLDNNMHWWIPSGLAFYHPDVEVSPPEELTEARKHFFLPRRFQDPFGNNSWVDYDDKYNLFVIKTRDAVGNETSVDKYDYRVLQPSLMTDPNDNQSEVAFDILGMVVGSAVMGKVTSNPPEGDSLNHFQSDLTQNQINELLDDPKGQIAHDLLGTSTSRIIYDVNRYQNKGKPTFAITLARETHVSDLKINQKTKLQISFSYSDGFGREIQKKVQAEKGALPKRDATGKLVLKEGYPEMEDGSDRLRWVGSGWTIFNNKGNPVRQYEPFFTDKHDFEFEVCIGVSPVLFYDPLGRVIATLHPNHTYDKVVFDPWKQTTWDVNDTVAADPRTDKDIASLTKKHFQKIAAQASSWKTWYEQRKAGALGKKEQQAAKKTAAHANTPGIAYFDTLGRPFLSVDDNGIDSNGNKQNYETRVELDIEGNEQEVIDARGNTIMRYAYNMAGPEEDEDEDEEESATNRIYQNSMDAGERWMLNDVSGNPIHSWDSRGHHYWTGYDALRRPIQHYVRGDYAKGNKADGHESDFATLYKDVVFERIIYGEGLANAKQLNLRTRPYQLDDAAGRVSNDVYDFKGNLLQANRQLAKEYHHVLDWSQNPELEQAEDGTAVRYSSKSHYDALNRPIKVEAPDKSIIEQSYNDAGLLETVGSYLQGSPTRTAFVCNIDYDAKGQRTLIQYGNGVETRYSYDRNTFRLIHLYTRKYNTYTAECEKINPPPAESADVPENPTKGKSFGLQNLRYSYDPIGNITYIRDDAHQTHYFKNVKVEPHTDYSYDALYRLIEASGREHLSNASPVPSSPAELPHSPVPDDGKAMGIYTQMYRYDEVGNILKMQHKGGDNDQYGWNRCYQYAMESNRLLSTSNPVDPNDRYNPCGDGFYATVSEDSVNYHPAYSDKYYHDAHGNMDEMPHLQLMQWDFQDQLQATAKQVVNKGTPETTYYVYDAEGERVRKVTERQAAERQTPTRLKERIYLGGFEIYREYGGDGKTVTLERETLHVMDDEQRIALVETKTKGVDASLKPLIRYQLGNHLGSASVELDEKAKTISYEEYYPYGSTSYHASNKTIKAAAKRYRYTGKERDEESGFYYHGARYYAAWLGRWTSCDPVGVDLDANFRRRSIGTSQKSNLYSSVANNPVNFIDPYGLQESQNEQLGLPTKYIPGEWGFKLSLTKIRDPDGIYPAAPPKSPPRDCWECEERGGYWSPGAMSTGTCNIPGSFRRESSFEKIAGELISVILLGVSIAFLGAGLPKGFKKPPAMRPPAIPQVKTPTATRLSDEQLIARSNEIFEQAAVAYLRDAGKPLTQGAIARMKREMTISVLQGEKSGRVATTVTVQDPKFQKYVEPLLGRSEEMVEPILAIRLNVRTGLPNKTGYVPVHSEQVLVADAKVQGLQNSRVATSNAGCPMCISVFQQAYPRVRHVNPSRTLPRTRVNLAR